MSLNKHNNNSGFTILELMIATAVFSVMLLIASTLVIQIGRMYYKGLNSSRTQEVTRSVVDDISRKLQFGAGTISTGNFIIDGKNYNTYCIADTMYVYRIYSAMSDSELYKEKNSGCTSPGSLSKNLLAKGMQLTYFKIDSVIPTAPIPVTVQIIYSSGGNDLINYDSAVFQNTNCKQNSGSEWCSVSTLATTLYRRIN